MKHWSKNYSLRAVHTTPLICDHARVNGSFSLSCAGLLAGAARQGIPSGYRLAKQKQ